MLELNSKLTFGINEVKDLMGKYELSWDFLVSKDINN
jgi:hypothetical protein